MNAAAKERRERVERVTRSATWSLLLFGSFHALALAAFFWRANEPWNLRVMIAGGACILAYAAAWLVWRNGHVLALLLGILAILGSLARIALPLELNVATYVTAALTMLFVIPVTHALIVVARD